MIALKKVAAAAGIAGALGLGGLAVGAGVANAEPASPGIPCQHADGWWGHGHGHGRWGDRDDWGPGPGWYGGGPGWGAPVGGCVSASGPFGFVGGNVCI